MHGRDAESCPACGTSRMRVHKASRRTRFIIQDCPKCGVHALADREAVFTGFAFTEPDRDCYTSYMAITRTDVLETSHLAVLEQLCSMLDVQGDNNHSLFDVGAGDGRFLGLAREAGFVPHGNELAAGAVELARERHAVTLLHGDLSELPDAGPYDVVTVWCVLAHIPQGDDLLRQIHRVLSPEGVLFMQTPRWSMMDRIAMALHDVSGGRWTKITDRRMAAHHMTLHTVRSLTEQLHRQGFEVARIDARARYSLNTASYLESLSIPKSLASSMSRVLDILIDRGWFFRNVVDVYARKVAVPEEAARSR